MMFLEGSGKNTLVYVAYLISYVQVKFGREENKQTIQKDQDIFSS